MLVDMKNKKKKHLIVKSTQNYPWKSLGPLKRIYAANLAYIRFNGPRLYQGLFWVCLPNVLSFFVFIDNINMNYNIMEYGLITSKVKMTGTVIGLRFNI